MIVARESTTIVVTELRDISLVKVVHREDIKTSISTSRVFVQHAEVVAVESTGLAAMLRQAILIVLLVQKDGIKISIRTN